MTMPGSKGRSRELALTVGALGLCAALAAPARAADDGYANVFSSVLGSVGLIKADPPPVIEYRERPPLVLPKDATLPKPEVGGLRHTAAWPQDPDLVKHRKALAEAHAPHTTNGDKVPLLSSDELKKGRIAEDEDAVPTPRCGNDGKHCLVLSPDELKREHEAYKAGTAGESDTVVADKEPDREYLTQPPKGFLKATKSTKATAEAPEQKLDQSSPRYMQQMEAKHRAEVENGE